MRSSDGEGRSIRSDALYPALSGEWEVPVTRNAKITPVNEGVGGRGRGASPPGSPLAGSPVTRNAEIDPGDNDPPPKMTQGGNDPLTPLHRLSTASLSGVVRAFRFSRTLSLISIVGFAIFAISSLESPPARVSISLSSSSHFAAVENSKAVNPVMLPPA